MKVLSLFPDVSCLIHEPLSIELACQFVVCSDAIVGHTIVLFFLIKFCHFPPFLGPYSLKGTIIECDYAELLFSNNFLTWRNCLFTTDSSQTWPCARVMIEAPLRDVSSCHRVDHAPYVHASSADFQFIMM